MTHNPRRFGRRLPALAGVLAVLTMLVAPALPAAAAPVDLDAVAASAEPSIVEIDTRIDYQGASANGTGIIIGSGGEVLTNFHVVHGADAIVVTTGGQQYPAVLLGFDRQHDIALLQVQGAGALPSAALGDSSTVAVGQPVVAIGNSDGTNNALSRSPGVVSELGRSLTAEDVFTGNSETLTNLIAVQADVRAGDSGGALVNEVGQVIGVISAASVTFRMDPGGEGFAIPINDALGIAGQIRSGAASDSIHIGPPTLLGVGINGAQQNDSGLVIRDVMRGGPAYQAGLLDGDVLISVDGTAVNSANELTTVLDRRYPGDVVDVVWIDRYGAQRTGKAPLSV